MLKKLLALLLLFPSLALAQSSPNWPLGYRPSVQEWNSQFSKKCDYPGCATDLTSPGPIGSVAPNTGVFTGLSATGAVSGAGFTDLFAAPPSIGNVTPGLVAGTLLCSAGAPPNVKCPPYNATLNGTLGADFPAYQAARLAAVGSIVVVPHGSQNLGANPSSGLTTPIDWELQNTYQSDGTTVVTGIGFDYVHNYSPATGYFWGRSNTKSTYGPLMRSDSTYGHVGGSGTMNNFLFNATVPYTASVNTNSGDIGTYVWPVSIVLNSSSTGTSNHVALNTVAQRLAPNNASGGPHGTLGTWTVNLSGGVITGFTQVTPCAGVDTTPDMLVTGNGTGGTGRITIAGGLCTAVVTAGGSGYTVAVATVTFSSGTPIWGANFVAQDQTGNPSRMQGGVTGLEINIRGNDLDDGGTPVGLAPGGQGLRLGLAINAAKAIAGATAEIGYGVRFGCCGPGVPVDGSDTYFKSVVNVPAPYSLAAFDTLFGTQMAGATTIRLRPGQTVSWNDPATPANQLGALTLDAGIGKLFYSVGGVNKFSIDASGNIKAAGTITASTTP